MIHQDLNGPWSFRRLGEQEWLPATVPGGVHTDLLALGRIPDPFVSDNEKDVQWIAENDWEYARVTAPIPPGWNLEQARQALRLRSLFDSYD